MGVRKYVIQCGLEANKMRVGRIDIVWGYIGYIFRFFSGFLLLPVLLQKLSSDELAIWYVFLAIGSMSQILDMGFGTTLTRNVSYACAGADSLNKTGIDGIYSNGKMINYELLAKIKIASRRIYQYISLIVLLLLLFGGSFYVYSLVKDFTEFQYYMIAWLVYALGIF